MGTDKLATEAECLEAVKSLKLVLARNSSVEALNFDHNFISDAQAKVLAEAVLRSRVRILTLRHCRFESISGLVSLLHVVLKKAGFEKIHLDFSVNKDQETGAALLNRFQKSWEKIHFNKEIQLFFQALMKEKDQVFSGNSKTLPVAGKGYNPAWVFTKNRLPAVKEEVKLPDINAHRAPRVRNPFR